MHLDAQRHVLASWRIPIFTQSVKQRFVNLFDDSVVSSDREMNRSMSVPLRSTIPFINDPLG